MVGGGIGLRNTETRLKHLYGDEATFTFEMDEDRIATTAVLLPALSPGQSPKTLQSPHEREDEAEIHARLDHRR